MAKRAGPGQQAFDFDEPERPSSPAVQPVPDTGRAFPAPPLAAGQVADLPKGRVRPSHPLPLSRTGRGEFPPPKALPDKRSGWSTPTP